MNADAEVIADAVTTKITAALSVALAPLLEAVAGSQALMTQAELAKAMGISVTQVKRFRAQGMPCVTLSERCPRFRVTDCIAWRVARPKASKSDPVAGGIRRISR